MLPQTIFVTNKTNIRYLCGFSGSKGYLLLVNKKGFLFTDGRYSLEAAQSLSSKFEVVDASKGFEKTLRIFLKQRKLHSLGVEGEYISLKLWKTLKRAAKNVKLTDVGRLLDKKRIIKTSQERFNIEKSQEITEKIFARLKLLLKKGQSEKDIAWEITDIAHEFGAEKTSFEPIVAINEASAAPHHQNSDRCLKKGDMLLIDMGVIYKGYCSDMTRVLFTENPTPEQQKIYEIVLHAQEIAIKSMKAGMTGAQIDSLARRAIAASGFAKEFSHALGHGVGLDIHELPHLSQKYKEKIPAGAIITVEPGIYLPGKFGIRLEDMVAMGKKKAFNLTRAPKSIQHAVVRLK